MVKAGDVDAQPSFAGHQFGQIEGETVGVVQYEGEIAAQLTRAHALGFFTEQFDASIESLVECLLLTMNDFLHMFAFGADLREHMPHCLCKDIHELIEKRLVEPE